MSPACKAVEVFDSLIKRDFLVDNIKQSQKGAEDGTCKWKTRNSRWPFG